MTLTQLSELMELVVEIDHKRNDVLMDKTTNHPAGITTVVFTVQPKKSRDNTKR